MDQQAAQASDITPEVTRGENTQTIQNSAEFLVDTLSLTIPRSALTEDVESRLWAMADSMTPSLDDETGAVDACQDLLHQFFGSAFVADCFSGKRNFFQFSVQTNTPGVFLAWGGNNKKLTPNGDMQASLEERIQIYISGEGCGQVADWGRVSAVAADYDARITRIDLAADFVDGGVTVQDFVHIYEEGGFATSPGRQPKASFVSDMGQGSGCTFYVGKRANGKMLRVYEKGKQLGDVDSPWVRIEAEIHSRDRVIPLDAITAPQRYLSGAYKPLAFLSDVQTAIRTYREKTQISVETAIYWARIQAGRLINFLSQSAKLSDSDIVANLTRAGEVPDRLELSLGALTLHDPRGLELWHASWAATCQAKRLSYLADLAALELDIPELPKNREVVPLVPVKVGPVFDAKTATRIAEQARMDNYTARVLNHRWSLPLRIAFPHQGVQS